MRRLYPYADIPLLRVALFFIGGIALGKYAFSDSLLKVLFPASCVPACLWCLQHFVLGRKRKFLPEAGSLLLLWAGCAGWEISGVWHRERLTRIRIWEHQEVLVKVELNAWPKQNRREDWVYTGTLLEIRAGKNWVPCGTGVYLTSRTGNLNITPGQILCVRTRLRAVPDTASGFHGYLYGIGTDFTGYVQEQANLGNSAQITGGALRLSAWCRDRLLEHIPDTVAAGLAVALITGDRSGLNREIADRHRQLGTTHILSVSGLHVGLICLILLKGLAWLEQINRRGSKVRLVVVMLSLSAYALLTGLAPSVCRSVIMTLVAMTGQLFNRKANGPNVLAFTAMAELAWSPCWLFYPGFQLSFAALAGLIWIQPLLADMWEPSGKWMSKIWDGTTTAIAAQWSTFPFLIPLSVAFPLYFLPANLLIVPMASLLTGLSFGLVLLSPIPGAASLIGYSIGWLSVGMDWLAGGIGSLPSASIPVPWNSASQAWMVGAVLFIPVAMWHYRRNGVK